MLKLKIQQSFLSKKILHREQLAQDSSGKYDDELNGLVKKSRHILLAVSKTWIITNKTKQLCLKEDLPMSSGQYHYSIFNRKGVQMI